MNNNKAQIEITTLLMIGALIAAIAAPIVYFTNIQTTVAVQRNDITTIQKNYDIVSFKLEKLNDKIDALLLKMNINLDKFK